MYSSNVLPIVDFPLPLRNGPFCGCHPVQHGRGARFCRQHGKYLHAFRKKCFDLSSVRMWTCWDICLTVLSSNFHVLAWTSWPFSMPCPCDLLYFIKESLHFAFSCLFSSKVKIGVNGYWRQSNEYRFWNPLSIAHGDSVHAAEERTGLSCAALSLSVLEFQSK